MVIGTFLTCQPVRKNKLIATIIVIFAAALMISDPHAMRAGESPNLFADVMSIIISIPWATYFYFSLMVKKYLSTE